MKWKKERQKAKCPECLTQVDQEELDMFGGLCEECHAELNNIYGS